MNNQPTLRLTGSKPIKSTPSTFPVPTPESVSRSTWQGKTLGEYEIAELLGAGGNGEVYRALHRWLQRGVAIKFLKNIQVGDTETVERFRREAQVAAQLIHPGIVRATDGGCIGSEVFLVTDLVEGCDLATLMRMVPRMRVADVCEIGRQAAGALQFIASKNIVHRDVKPSNMMLDRDGCVKLLDLGLARINHHGHTMTATGQVMGTIDYMSPEQASDPRRVNHLADIYSLGCTLYFLLVGRPPIQTDHHDTLAAKLIATLDRVPDPVRNSRRDVPPALAALIERMMEKEPERRPQSFAAIGAELAKYTKGADPAALLESQGTVAPRTHKAVSLSDQIADAIVAAMWQVCLLVLIFMGFVEARPTSRPGQRKTYRLSSKWLKPVIPFVLLVTALWLSGIRFSPRTELMCPDQGVPQLVRLPQESEVHNYQSSSQYYQGNP